MSRVREEAGIGLIELLVAMVVMSIGIFALVAGFSSGYSAIDRASKTSIAGTVADKEMEAYRRGSYAAITPWADTRVGGDNRDYWVVTTVTPALVCVDGHLDSGLSCSSNGGALGREVKTVKITVHDGTSSSNPVLITESSTFDQATG